MKKLIFMALVTFAMVGICGLTQQAGATGKPVNVTITNATKNPLDVTLVRDEWLKNMGPYRLEPGQTLPGVGYSVPVENFNGIRIQPAGQEKPKRTYYAVSDQNGDFVATISPDTSTQYRLSVTLKPGSGPQGWITSVKNH